jgi:hypothetical protein
MANGGLIYDGSTGHLVRDGASTQHEVFVRWNKVASFGYVWQKIGDAGTFAGAKSAMEAAAWASGDYRASSTYQLIGMDYYCEAAAIRFDLDDIGMTGSTVEAWGLRIANVTLDTSACRVGFVNTASDTPTDAWSWLDGADSATRTTEGWLSVHFGAVAARYVFALLSMYPYADPSGPGGEYFLHDDATCLRVYF